MTTDQLNLIKENAMLVIKQVQRIEGLHTKLRLATNEDNPYYQIFGSPTERRIDVILIEKQINEAETVLNGMMA